MEAPTTTDWRVPWLVAWTDWYTGEPNNGGSRCAFSKPPAWLDTPNCYEKERKFICKNKGNTFYIRCFIFLRNAPILSTISNDS